MATTQLQPSLCLAARTQVQLQACHQQGNIRTQSYQRTLRAGGNKMTPLFCSSPVALLEGSSFYVHTPAFVSTHALNKIGSGHHAWRHNGNTDLPAAVAFKLNQMDLFLGQGSCIEDSTNSTNSDHLMFVSMRSALAYVHVTVCVGPRGEGGEGQCC